MVFVEGVCLDFIIMQALAPSIKKSSHPVWAKPYPKQHSRVAAASAALGFVLISSSIHTDGKTLYSYVSLVSPPRPQTAIDIIV